MDDRQSQISEWLDKLQRESWNLELLISGFSIFLLIQAQDVLSNTINYLGIHYYFLNNVQALVLGFLGILKLASFILTFNLLLHILLRGFWIGAIGLRSVQEKIDFKKLNYSAFFTEKLPKKVSTLDQLLVNLDNFSSIIFAFTFLVIFMLISLFLGISFIGVIGYLLSLLKGAVGAGVAKILAIPIVLIMISLLLSGLIYMIDTLSLGFFKKYKWTSKLYYPIYVLFGIVTLSFVYRGIYYSLISRYSKRRVRLFFIPYIFLIFLAPFFKYDQYVFFPDDDSNQNFLPVYYDDIRKEGSWIARASIPSQQLSSPFFPLFIRYDIQDNKHILAACSDYTPSKKGGLKSGLSFKGGIFLQSPNVPEADPKKLLACLSQFYNIYLNDSLYSDLEYLYFEHPNQGEKGIYTMVDTKALPRGKQTLTIKKKEVKEEKTVETEYVSFPFWIAR